jgi:UDP-N-acetylmuramoyl-L-alanyl-D-glutamate--2,6-diaminopimelate ligase
MWCVRLAELIDAVPSVYRDREVVAVVADSRLARPAALFVACPGTRFDGHTFIAQAVRAGCAAIVGSRELADPLTALVRERDIPYLRVDDPAQALGELAARINGRPSTALTVVGVTGTNGKTTVATLLYELFSMLGQRSGLIATTGIRVANDSLPNTHTTPGAVELQRLLALMVAAGCRYCFMEVTSHAIDQRRIAGVDFAGGIFTSLGHDHLDYHGTIDSYARVKQRFLGDLPAAAFALANADDDRGRFMVATTRARVVFYGSGGEALLPWALEQCDDHGMSARIGPRRVRMRLVARHNAANLAAVLTAATLLGYELDQTAPLVPRLEGAPGRMQRVVSGSVLGIVDYAHTPEAVKLALATARELRPEGRLLVVAGCGGDRDREKRPAIGGALAMADTAIFTADNPRSEDPDAIAAAMLRGVRPARRPHVQVELDRRRAIERAGRLARPGDVILLLGKGHETVQQIGTTKQPWDDPAELRAALNRGDVCADHEFGLFRGHTRTPRARPTFDC